MDCFRTLENLEHLCVDAYLRMVAQTLLNEVNVKTEISSFGPRQNYPSPGIFSPVVSAHISLLEAKITGIASSNIRSYMLQCITKSNFFLPTSKSLVTASQRKHIRDSLFFICFNEDVGNIYLSDGVASVDQFCHINNILNSDTRKSKLKNLCMEILQLEPSNPNYRLPDTIFSRDNGLVSITLNVKIRGVVYSGEDQRYLDVFLTGVTQVGGDTAT